jgi:hypothetical protein
MEPWLSLVDDRQRQLRGDAARARRFGRRRPASDAGVEVAHDRFDLPPATEVLAVHAPVHQASTVPPPSGTIGLRPTDEGAMR